MRRTIDYSLYLVTDRLIAHPRPVGEIVTAAVRGGIGIVQLREKESSTKSFIETARLLKTLLHRTGVPLIINDRVDVALAAGADGVHLGQQDMPYAEARRLLGTDAIIGLSVETMDQALEAENADIDYLGISPVFHTPTKTDTTTEWGIEGVRKLRRKTRRPLVAIGGINATNAESVLEAGADGIAVVSAICAASDPEQATRELRKIADRVGHMRKGAHVETERDR